MNLNYITNTMLQLLAVHSLVLNYARKSLKYDLVPNSWLELVTKQVGQHKCYGYNRF